MLLILKLLWFCKLLFLICWMGFVCVQLAECQERQNRDKRDLIWARCLHILFD